MKHKIIVFLLLSNVIFAQKGLVQYGFIDALGSGNAKGPDSNAYMVFDKEQSYFVTAKDSLENGVNKNEQKVYEIEGGGGTISDGLKVSEQGDQVVYHIILICFNNYD